EKQQRIADGDHDAELAAVSGQGQIEPGKTGFELLAAPRTALAHVGRRWAKGSMDAGVGPAHGGKAADPPRQVAVREKERVRRCAAQRVWIGLWSPLFPETHQVVPCNGADDARQLRQLVVGADPDV